MRRTGTQWMCYKTKKKKKTKKRRVKKEIQRKKLRDLHFGRARIPPRGDQKRGETFGIGGVKVD